MEPANTTNDLKGLPRSPELMSRRDTALLVIDVQENLISAILEGNRMVWNIRRLLDAAKLLGVPVFATEQYPKGLGRTVDSLSGRLDFISDKTTFSCGGSAAVTHILENSGLHKVLLAGIETHVCVQQTAYDLSAHGFRVYLAADAVGTRDELDHRIALRRLESSGVTLTTTEAALFEWCEDAAAVEFKSISNLVKESPPPDSVIR